MTTRRLGHRPFRSLGPPQRSRTPPEPAATEAPGGALRFSEAAAALGTKPLRGGQRRVPPSESRGNRRPSEPLPFVVEEDDPWVQGYRSDLGPRALAKIRGMPGATLDLHRTTAALARARLAAFLAAQAAKGTPLVLVVVGKGLHSPGGVGILRAGLASFLTTGSASAHVLAFRTAPPSLGGTGAVLVLLATRQSQR